MNEPVKATITITESEDGRCDIRVGFNPAIEEGELKYTSHKLAMALLQLTEEPGDIQEIKSNGEAPQEGGSNEV